MSWYVSQDGEQIWIARDETVYTLVECDEKKLPLENLTYLTVNSRKTVYHEHTCAEDLLADGKSRVPRRKRDNNSGRERGFILRAEVEETPLQRVVPCFKASAQKLVDDHEVSRVDADDAVNTKRKKNKEEKRVNLNLGLNECRVETTARINHFAHGAGFRVEVAQGSVTQRIYFYTGRRQIPYREWHEVLTEAIASTGSHVMLARRAEGVEADAAKEGQDGTGDKEKDDLIRVTKIRKDKAQQEDEAWLERMMGMAGEEEGDQGSDPDSGDQPAEDEHSASVLPAPVSSAVASAPLSFSPTARPATARATAAPSQTARSAAASSQTSRSAAAPSQTAWSAAAPSQTARPTAVPSQPSREPKPAEPTRSTRAAPERWEPTIRDWRHVRDPPEHLGYTKDWSAEAPEAGAEAQEWRDWRQRDNNCSGWSDYPRDQSYRDWDEWKPRDNNTTANGNSNSSSNNNSYSRWSDQSRDRSHWDHDEWKSRGPAHRSEHQPRGQGGEARVPTTTEHNWRLRDPAQRVERPHAERHAGRNGRPAAQGQDWLQKGRQAAAAAGPAKKPQQQQQQQQKQQRQPQQQPQQPHQAPKERAKAPQSRTSKAVRDQGAKCFECGRGKPLKLFLDEDDGNPYCHACWVEFYGLVPPLK